MALAPLCTRATSSPRRITSATCTSAWRGSWPRGWLRAKSSAEKPRLSSSATASASPSASAAVVLAVGARLCGQASCATAASRCTSASRASADSGLPVSAISLAPRRFTSGTICSSSSLAPEYEMAMNTSPRLDHAEVAVARLGRVHEVGRRAGARKRGGDLARDVAGLAHAAHHHAALALMDEIDRIDEFLIEPLDQCAHRIGFDREHATRELQHRARSDFPDGGSRPYHAGEYSPWTIAQ